MASRMSLVDSMEFFVLGEPTAEHAEAPAAIRGVQYYSQIAST